MHGHSICFEASDICHEGAVQNRKHQQVVFGAAGGRAFASLESASTGARVGLLGSIAGRRQMVHYPNA